MSNKTDIAAQLVTTLRTLGLPGGVHRRRFAQSDVPVWPAVRYTFIDAVPSITIEGDGGEETADYRVQIDLVASEHAGEVAFAALCGQLKDAMAGLQPTWVWDNESDDDDSETKTIRLQIDYLVYLSSAE